MVELMGWYSANGVDEANLIGFNKGGTVEVAGVRFTMTNAFHSSSTPDGTVRRRSGRVRRLRRRRADLLRGGHDRLRRHAVDRASLRADVVVLPIGGHTR